MNIPSGLLTLAQMRLPLFKERGGIGVLLVAQGQAARLSVLGPSLKPYKFQKVVACPLRGLPPPCWRGNSENISDSLSN